MNEHHDTVQRFDTIGDLLWKSIRKSLGLNDTERRVFFESKNTSEYDEKIPEEPSCTFFIQDFTDQDRTELQNVGFEVSEENYDNIYNAASPEAREESYGTIDNMELRVWNILYQNS